MLVFFVFCVFFFKQKTAYEMRISDWSSDVCSSDLTPWSSAKGRGFVMSQTTRVLWVNPVGYPDYDVPMGELMAGVKAADTEIDLVSLNTSPLPNHLEYRTYEALIVADMVRLARMADAEAYDAMVIGCFYDPGLGSEENTAE